MKNTIKPLLITILVTYTSSIYAQSDNTAIAQTATSYAQAGNPSFAKIIGTEPTVEINLGKMMLGLLSSATENETGISTILSGLDAIKVTVFELEDTKKLKSIKAKINNLVQFKIANGFEKLATVREDDSLVYVLAKMDEKNFRSLSVYALDDDDELVLIEINGAILLSQLGDLMGHFNLDLDLNGMKLKNHKKKD